MKQPGNGTAKKAFIEEELSKRVIGKDSRLSFLSDRGDVQGLGRFANAVSRSLSSAKEDIDGRNVSTQEKNSREIKRKEVSAKIAGFLRLVGELHC